MHFYFLGYLFTFLMLSFEKQVFLISMASNLFFFSFVAYASGGISKRTLLSEIRKLILCSLL